jgi:hypothetical protein
LSAEMRMVNRNFAFGIPIILGTLLVLILIAMAVQMINAPIHLNPCLPKRYEDTESVLANPSEENVPTFVGRCSRCGIPFNSIEQAQNHLEYCLPSTACDKIRQDAVEFRKDRQTEFDDLP